MDHEYGIVSVDYEHNLQELATRSGAPYQVLLLILDERIWRTSAADDLLSLFRRDAVRGQVLFIPFVPSKLHEASITLIDYIRN